MLGLHEHHISASGSGQQDRESGIRSGRTPTFTLISHESIVFLCPILLLYWGAIILTLPCGLLIHFWWDSGVSFLPSNLYSTPQTVWKYSFLTDFGRKSKSLSWCSFLYGQAPAHLWRSGGSLSPLGSLCLCCSTSWSTVLTTSSWGPLKHAYSYSGYFSESF